MFINEQAVSHSDDEHHDESPIPLPAASDEHHEQHAPVQLPALTTVDDSPRKATEIPPAAAAAPSDEHSVVEVQAAPHPVPVKPAAWPEKTLQVVLPPLLGIIFGYLLVLGGVYEPSAVRDQMVFTRYVLLKIFLAAAGTGQLIMVALALTQPARFEKVRQANITTTLDFRTAALGGALLGLGMYVSGACPGMVLAQVGSGVPNALWTMFGCLIGAGSYGFLQPYLPMDAHTLYFQKNKPSVARSLDKLLGVAYWKLALCMSLAMLAVVCVLEWQFPYGPERPQDFQTNSQDPRKFALYGWPPGLAGVVIGALQLPLFALIGKVLGSSSSYVTCAAQLCSTAQCEAHSFHLLKSKKKEYWQVLYVVGAVLGGFLASRPIEANTTYGVTVPAAIIGGVLLLWGSRLAGGCTSGHGLSGMGFLNLQSLVAVPAMFGTAIATGFIVQAAAGLPYAS